MNKTSETILEQTTLDWFESIGWQTAFGPDISPDLPAPRPGLFFTCAILCNDESGYSDKQTI